MNLAENLKVRQGTALQEGQADNNVRELKTYSSINGPEFQAQNPQKEEQEVPFEREEPEQSRDPTAG